MQKTFELDKLSWLSMVVESDNVVLLRRVRRL